MSDRGHRFHFQRLAVVGVAEEYVAAIARVLEAIPRGEAKLRGQLRDSSDSVYLNLCEGAGRFKPADKARFYDIALGSGTESGGALRIVRIRKLVSPPLVARAEGLLERVLQMVSRIVIAVRSRGSG